MRGKHGMVDWRNIVVEYWCWNNLYNRALSKLHGECDSDLICACECVNVCRYSRVWCVNGYEGGSVYGYVCVGIKLWVLNICASVWVHVNVCVVIRRGVCLGLWMRVGFGSVWMCVHAWICIGVGECVNVCLSRSASLCTGVCVSVWVCVNVCMGVCSDTYYTLFYVHIPFTSVYLSRLSG